MGLFRKKSYHVDEAGKVAEGEEPGYRSVKELRGPSRYEQFKQSRAEERKAYNEGRLEGKADIRINRIKKAREQGRRAGSITMSDRLESFAKVAQPSKPVRVGTRSRPVRYNPPGLAFNYNIKPVRNKPIRYNTNKNYNPFGNMFDTGIGYKKPKIQKASQRFAVVGGKAYPIANIGKKKKSKKKHSKNPFSFDMADNWGLMK
jgi:hypothetical protein